MSYSALAFWAALVGSWLRWFWISGGARWFCGFGFDCAFAFAGLVWRAVLVLVWAWFRSWCWFGLSKVRGFWVGF